VHNNKLQSNKIIDAIFHNNCIAWQNTTNNHLLNDKSHIIIVAPQNKEDFGQVFLCQDYIVLFCSRQNVKVTIIFHWKKSKKTKLNSQRKERKCEHIPQKKQLCHNESYICHDGF